MQQLIYQRVCVISTTRRYFDSLGSARLTQEPSRGKRMELRYSLDISQALNPPCQILLDAEIYDAGPSRSLTEGFKIAVIHQFDMAIMSQSGLNINTGSLTQAGAAAAHLDSSVSSLRLECGPSR